MGFKSRLALSGERLDGGRMIVEKHSMHALVVLLEVRTVEAAISTIETGIDLAGYVRVGGSSVLHEDEISLARSSGWDSLSRRRLWDPVFA